MAEQLFDLPLKSGSGFDLNSIAQAINKELKTTGEESFVEDVTDDPRRKALQTALEIVKDVIKTKQEENSARLNKAKRADERRRILDAMSAKQEQALSAASIEDLQKQLDALDE